MSSTPAWLAQAQAEGVLPSLPPLPPARPWPVVALSGVAAWIVVVPLMAAFLSLFGAFWGQGPSDWILGIGLIALGLVLLRGTGRAIFLEQMGLPLLLTGLVSLAHALNRHMSEREVQAVLLGLDVVLILLLPIAWLRQLLGAAAAVLTMLLIGKGEQVDLYALPFWREAHVAAVVGGLLMALQQRMGRQAPGARWAAVMEPALGGWWVVVLGALMLSAGSSFLISGAMVPKWGGSASVPASDYWRGIHLVVRLVSAALVLAGAWGLVRAWRPAQSWRLALPAGVLAGVALFLPTLGACLAVLSLMLITRRWRLAALAALAAVWVLGSFYYHWALPLQQKALVMVGAGVLLAVWALWMAPPQDKGAGPTQDSAPREPQTSAGVASPSSPWARPLLGLFALLALATVNLLIVQKETLIGEGRPVFVPLAPVDPRSLMQGDYMQLAYALPGTGRWTPSGADLLAQRGGALWGERRRVAVQLDERGIVRSPRLLATDEPVPPGMLAVELTPADGGWTLVTNAWYFKEGTQARWAAARYGEFRLTPDGRALLVNLVGEDLRPL